MHQYFIFDASGCISGKPDVFVRLEGGNSLDKPDGSDRNQVVLIPGLRVILLGRLKQKEEFSRSKTTP